MYAKSLGGTNLVGIIVASQPTRKIRIILKGRVGKKSGSKVTPSTYSYPSVGPTLWVGQKTEQLLTDVGLRIRLLSQPTSSSCFLARFNDFYSPTEIGLCAKHPETTEQRDDSFVFVLTLTALIFAVRVARFRGSGRYSIPTRGFQCFKAEVLTLDVA